MATWKLYLTATNGDKFTKQGAWDSIVSTIKTLAESKDGTLGYQAGTIGSTDANWDLVLCSAYSPPLSEARTFSGTISGCIGLRGAAGANAYPHIHVWVRAGSSGSTVRGTLLTDHIDSDNELGTTPYGREFSATMTEVAAQAGDTIMAEFGIRTSASSQPLYARAYFGGTNATDLSEGADATTYTGWIQMEYTAAAVGKPHYYFAQQ